MSAGLRNLLGILGTLLLLFGLVVQGLSWAGIWDPAPQTRKHRGVNTIPNIRGGYQQVPYEYEEKLPPKRKEPTFIEMIALPFGGIGVVLLMIYGFTARKASSPHPQESLEFQDPLTDK